MRVVSSLLVAVLGAALTIAPPRAPAAGAPVAGAAGDWETLIASPRRPWIFTVRLERAGHGWTGSLRAEGLPVLPLHDVRVDATRVRFRFPAELDSLPFEGTLEGDRIVGRVPEGGRTTPTRLTRVVPLPAPAGRVESWRQDIAWASEHVSAYDRSFDASSRARFQRALARLARDVPRLDDARIMVGLSRAVALAGNAHTWLRMEPTRGGSLTTELPIRVWWFADGPYVIRAAPSCRRALRCRVVAINGHDMARVRRRVDGLFAGNAPWASYIAPLYLTSPDYLYGLGLIPDMKGARFTFADERGARFDLDLPATPIVADAKPSESWQEMSPALVTGRPPWIPALEATGDRLPLYLRHPDQPYWLELLPRQGLLYFQFNRSENAERGPTFQDLADSLLAIAARRTVRDVVVDLRFNSGGDLDVAKAFFQGLGRNARINRRGHLFVITGPCTFSAGLYHAAQLRQLTKATFVGEPVGDRLDFWAEGGKLVLPNSRAAIWYSNGFHRYSKVAYPRNRPYYEQLSIATLAPDVPTPLTSSAYLAGRDPSLEAIAARMRSAR